MTDQGDLFGLPKRKRAAAGATHKLSPAQVSRMTDADGRIVDLFADPLHDARVKAAATGRTREYESRKAGVRRRVRDPDRYTEEIKRVAAVIKY